MIAADVRKVAAALRLAVAKLRGTRGISLVMPGATLSHKKLEEQHAN